MQFVFGLTGAAIVVLPFAVAATAFDAAPAPSRHDVANTRRAAANAVAKSLPLLQSSADTWFEKRTCSSCHHQGLGMVAVATAREFGMAVDTVRLRGQVVRTSRLSPSGIERYVTGDPSTNEAIGQGYRAIGVGAAGYAPSIFTDAVVRMLAGKQHASGRWSSYSRRPPHEDSEFTATALSVRAIALFARAPDAVSARARIVRARRWLERATPVDHEDRVMQLLGLGWSGATPADVATFATNLLTTQRADGGWAQIPTRDSDAYATGQALVALNQVAGVPMRDARMQRALGWLTQAQRPDGSWHVVTRRTRSEGLPYFESGYPHGEDQFISYAGAAWATLALTLAQQERRSIVVMGNPAAAIVLPVDSSAMPDLTPLMWAVWRGDAALAKRLLASGASTHDTTRSGLSPLMFAAGNADMVRLLLDAGADANAITGSGYSALLLASAYDGGGDAAALLLERGATPDVTGRTGSFRQVTPLAAAIVRGDTILAAHLLQRGANVHGGTKTPETPMLAATFYGDGVATGWLLQRGASVDDGLAHAGSDAAPLLGIAAEDGRNDVVRELLRAGAPVDAVDQQGYTALHIAVSCPDRGSSDIVMQLLRAGADPLRATKDGETAVTLARKWAPLAIVAVVDSAATAQARHPR